MSVKLHEIKLLVSGDVNGNFSALFSKVGAVHKNKGPFEYLLCIGNFFSSDAKEWEDVMSGKVTAPVTTYVFDSNIPEYVKSDSPNLAPNISIFCNKGTIAGTTGLKIAYLNGIEQFRNAAEVEKSKYFSLKGIKLLLENISSEGIIDILLTSQWPHDVTKYALSVDMAPKNIEEYSSGLISFLAKEMKPRYHFSALAGVYYERVPYRNHAVLQQPPLHVTRFFGLASVNNEEKSKWLYGFSIIPASHMTHKKLTEISGLVSNCPYDAIEFLSDVKEQNEFFFGPGPSASTSKRKESDQPGSETKKKQFLDPSSCWFCLANKDVESHLIISVGDYCYVTLAKGGLVPEHVLIIPIHHAVNSMDLSPDELKEMNAFKESLATYYHEKNNDVVFFERNYSSPHLQIQVVPVPKNFHQKIKDELCSLAQEHRLIFSELPLSDPLIELVSSKEPFFWMELVVDKCIETRYLHLIKKKFPLQFGREVLAEVLNMPDRVDWKKCFYSKEAETRMSKEMKMSYLPYDFN